MTNIKTLDIIKSLEMLSDDEAIAIMEDRAPSSDLPETDQAALSFTQRLLDDSNNVEDIHSAQNDNVVEYFTRQQPWMKMAAALMLGVLISTLVDTGMRTGESGFSSTSANVVFLETTRSVNTSDLPVVSISGEDPWITLIAYPDFTEADLLRVFVERAQEVGAGSPGQQGQRWAVILEQTSSIGTQDSIVVNVNSKLFTAGVHRLRIESEAGGRKTGSTQVSFLVR